MRKSLIGRIARYGVSPLRDSREDRLTEILAALCDSPHCPGLARHVALGWLKRATEQPDLYNRDAVSQVHEVLSDTERDWSCLVRTQVRISTGDGARQPDLELRFDGTRAESDSVSVALWVEVKHGTPPHTGQLRAYLEGQRDRRLRNAVVLLVASRDEISSFATDEIPPGVPRLSWQDTAERINSALLDSG